MSEPLHSSPADLEAVGEAATGLAEISRLAAVSWTDFVTASGPEGERWVERYHRDDLRHTRAEITDALYLGRRRRLDEAGALLEGLDQQLSALPDDTHRLVLRRYYLGSWAFLCYMRKDFDGAERASSDAAEAIRVAIDRDRFLVPLAHHCTEFCYQRARIARNQLRWNDMAALLREVHGMLTDQRPYCRLDDGTAIFARDVRRFYEQIPTLGDELRAGLAKIDSSDRLALFHRFVGKLYLQPGLVIAYP